MHSVFVAFGKLSTARTKVVRAVEFNRELEQQRVAHLRMESLRKRACREPLRVVAAETGLTRPTSGRSEAKGRSDSRMGR